MPEHISQTYGIYFLIFYLVRQKDDARCAGLCLARYPISSTSVIWHFRIV